MYILMANGPWLISSFWPGKIFHRASDNNHYYPFKIFLCFWLAKIPPIIHHNQSSYHQPNLEEFCNMWKMTSTVQHNCHETELLTEKTWDKVKLFWKWVQNSGTFHLLQKEEIGALLAKNIATTARRQLYGQHVVYTSLACMFCFTNTGHMIIL